MLLRSAPSVTRKEWGATGFGEADFFVPRMLIARRGAMQGRARILRPLLGRDRRGPDGRHICHGNRQGRRPRHRKNLVKHHARGGRLPPCTRPSGVNRRTRGVQRRQSTSNKPDIVGLLGVSSRRQCRCSRRTYNATRARPGIRDNVIVSWSAGATRHQWRYADKVGRGRLRKRRKHAGRDGERLDQEKKASAVASDGPASI